MGAKIVSERTTAAGRMQLQVECLCICGGTFGGRLAQGPKHFGDKASHARKHAMQQGSADGLHQGYQEEHCLSILRLSAGSMTAQCDARNLFCKHIFRCLDLVATLPNSKCLIQLTRFNLFNGLKTCTTRK